MDLVSQSCGSTKLVVKTFWTQKGHRKTEPQIPASESVHQQSGFSVPKVNGEHPMGNGDFSPTNWDSVDFMDVMLKIATEPFRTELGFQTVGFLNDTI